MCLQWLGARRMVDVIDVNTQQALEMTLQQWVKYFTSEDREEIYNVISLEFSHTKLEDFVEPPEVVSIFSRIADFFMCFEQMCLARYFLAIIFMFLWSFSSSSAWFGLSVSVMRVHVYNFHYWLRVSLKMSFNSVTVIFHWNFSAK